MIVVALAVCTLIGDQLSVISGKIMLVVASQRASLGPHGPFIFYVFT